MTMDASEKRRLGGAPLTVTRLGLGTAAFGALFEPVADTEAEATIARAWELGLRFFDTAPLYGNGLAERRLGRVLSGMPRDAFTLATKVGRPRRTDDGASVFDYSRDGVMRSLEGSLDRLGVDRVDVLHVHDADDHMEEALAHAFPALAELRAQGVIGAVGAGMHQASALVRFAREADFDCFLLAGRHTLLDHASARELVALCERQGIALVVGGVYNSGILAGAGSRAMFDYRPAPRELRERVGRLEAVCAAHDVPLTAAAIQFPFGAPAVASVLSGSRSVAELEQNVRMLETPVPQRLWDDLRAEHLLYDEGESDE